MEATRIKAARAHLTLAEGLIEAAEITAGSSEYEIRNAFSRSYYALFHACCGYLLAQNAPNAQGVAKKHGSLHAEMEKWMGKEFGRFLRGCYELRRKSDYQAEWAMPPFFERIEKLELARRQCYFVTATAKSLISTSAVRDPNDQL